ncbi:14 kDa phosphohistidine phosphatase [Eurytemora carolleeae]|uniref:14 kDa phosphohistidine phosphatase n=1 Tax=Eurytemora carolleeae TaxID=1294199 RepID=UPI000C75D432|nr:14 kDa phosphohistidine phosphatase [Eurytemora carolleeae]|eukprot:XP_023331945.1 14 kDa phosphohistidine phosphatase-like [Eurytemora affinis]
MTEDCLNKVPDVEIDSGVFKYVYIRVYADAGGDERLEKDIVRGYTFAEYHADIYDRIDEEVQKLGLDCECMGGGRIEHSPERKYIKVYGYSMGYGKANHERSIEILKKKYPDYNMEWSDEGY